MALKDKKVGFIGSGAMAEALLKGLLKAKIVNKTDIYSSDINQDRLAQLKKEYGVKISKTNKELINSVDIVILAVKPFIMGDILKDTGKEYKKGQLVISIAAGIPISFYESLLPHEVPVIRVMPNTPSLIGLGVSALALGKRAQTKDAKSAEEILYAVGKVVTVSESQMDGVTGLSGSGPAYIYLIIEALIDAGVRVGLPRDIATVLATQTLIGSAQMVVQTGESPAKLKEMVTTPGGTTIAGLHKLEEGKLRATIMNAVVEATRRSEELGNK